MFILYCIFQKNILSNLKYNFAIIVLSLNSLTASDIIFNDLALENRVQIIGYLFREDFMNAVHSCRALYQAAHISGKERIFKLQEKNVSNSNISNSIALRIKPFFSKIKVHHVKDLMSTDWEYFLKHSTYLTEIDVANSNFNSEALKYNNLKTSLKQLNLNNITINNKQQKVQSQFIKDYSNLEMLNLSFNILSLSAIKKLANGLKKNKSLRTISLCCCQINDESMIYLLDSLKNYCNISIMHLSSNNINNRGAESLAKFLHSNTSLIELYLDHNSMDNEGILRLLESMLHNKPLQILEIRHNKMLYNEDTRRIVSLIRATKPYSAITF